jgi:hypothetical protein
MVGAGFLCTLPGKHLKRPMRPHLFCIVIAILSFPSFAQNYFGVKGGINVNTIRLSDDFPNDPSELASSIGYHVGAFYHIRVREKISFIPELQFSTKGAKSKTGSDESVFRLSYLELPLIFSFRVVDKLSIDAGAYAAYKVGENTYSGDLFKDFDAGFTGGLRVNFSDRIGITARYCMGVTPIVTAYFRDFNNNPIVEVKSFNRNIQFGMTYAFPSRR